MDKLGIKHLIECHCTLQIFKGRDEHLYHKFPVYSKIDNTGKVIQKYVQCNNCKTIHSVYDICKSDIIRSGQDSLSGAISIEDIGYNKAPLINAVGSICDPKHNIDLLELWFQMYWLEHYIRRNLKCYSFW